MLTYAQLSPFCPRSTPNVTHARKDTRLSPVLGVPGNGGGPGDEASHLVCYYNQLGMCAYELGFHFLATMCKNYRAGELGNMAKHTYKQ